MIEKRYLSGAAVYGDDLDRSAIQRWYAAEQEGFYSIAQANGELYEGNSFGCFHEMNRQLGFSHVADRRFEHCLSLGTADGQELVPIAPQVDRFTAVEPASKWWSEEISGVPTTYIRPEIDRIPLPDGDVDLAICFGSMHHIPNVTDTINELGRVTRSGGVLMLREPICTMGDWTRPRAGLTANERGFPVEWLTATVEAAKFKIQRRSYCVFPAIPRLAKLLRQPGYGYNSRWLTRFDRILSKMFSWNLHYHRDRAYKKVAPSTVQILAVRM